MRLLLDTQIALWWLTASSRLVKASRDLMARSPCVVSVASVWEMMLKLSISDDHVLGTADVPDRHRDPFDRLLLSVAQAEHLVLLTADEALIALGQTEPRLPIRAA